MKKYTKKEIKDFIENNFFSKEEKIDKEDLKIYVEEVEEDLRKGKSFKLILLEREIKNTLSNKLVKISESVIEEDKYPGLNNTNYKYTQLEDIEEIRYLFENGLCLINFAPIEVIHNKELLLYNLELGDLVEFKKEDKINMLKDGLKSEDVLMNKKDFNLVERTLEEAFECFGESVSLKKTKINGVSVPIKVIKYGMYDEIKGITELVKIDEKGFNLIHYKKGKNQKHNKGISLIKEINKEKLEKILNGNKEIDIKEYIKNNQVKTPQILISNNDYQNNFTFN